MLPHSQFFKTFQVDANNTYPGFEYRAEQLAAYGLVIRVFFLITREWEVVRYEPYNPIAFLEWLEENNVSKI